jgi:hypothetical protein
MIKFILTSFGINIVFFLYTRGLKPGINITFYMYVELKSNFKHSIYLS